MSRYALPAVILAMLWGTARADDVRFYEHNGVTYRETLRTVQRPVSETQYQTQQRTVLREQVTTDTRQVVNRQWVPVRDWRYETRWIGRFNPFVQPTPVQKLVPYTRWELREDVTQVPVTRRELVPETVEVQVPVTTRRLVQQDVVSQRVAVQPTRPAASTTTAQSTRTSAAQQLANRPTFGGIANLDANPPSSSEWRPSTRTMRR